MVYSLMKRSIITSWPTLAIIAVTLITLRFAYHFSNKDRFIFHKEFWNFVSIIYLILLYDLVTRAEINVLSGMNLKPFTEIFRYELGSELFLFNVIGNICLFIPFGYIISTYIKPKNAWSSIITGLIVSSTIELVQLNIGRSFDIDDIILNVLGCFIGYLCYIGFKAILNHLPNFIKSDWFNNLICIIITICITIYILNIMGVQI